MRILVADDHGIVRSGIRLLLERQPGLDVVAEAADGVEAVEQALAARPDLCILDVGMPRMTGLQAAREIRSHLKDVRVLMLSMHDDEHYLFEALKAGASGYVLKREADQDLVGAVHAVGRGEAFLTNAAERSIIRRWMEGGDGGPAISLTPREEEVVKLIAEAHTNAQIAEILHLSEKTVESHRANVLRKLGMRDRVELVRYAIRRGLVEPVFWAASGGIRGAMRPRPDGVTWPHGRRAPARPLSIGARARPGRPHRRPPVPAPDRRGSTGGRTGYPMLLEFWDFCRVQSIRTLPYVKAWHERYAGPARWSASTPPASRPRRTPTRSALRWRDWTCPTRSRSTPSTRSGACTATSAGRRGTCSTSAGCCSTTTTARAPTRRPSWRSRSCSGSSSRCSRRSDPRRRRTRSSSPRPTTSRGRTRGRTRPAACGRCSTATARSTVNGRTIAVDHPGAYELIAHERSTTAELALEIGDGVTCHAVCFTPGLARLTSSGGPSSATITANPGR